MFIAPSASSNNCQATPFPVYSSDCSYYRCFTIKYYEYVQCRLSAYKSVYIKCQDVQHTMVAGRGWVARQSRGELWTGFIFWSFESFAEAGERLCDPVIGREPVPPLRSQNREKLWLCWPTFHPFTRSPIPSSRLSVWLVSMLLWHDNQVE